MILECPLVVDGEELVQQARVPDIELGRLDLSLLEIRVPRLELTDHLGVGQEIAVAATARRRHAERACGFRRIPDLGVEVGDQRPEPSQGRIRCSHAPLREIPLEQRLDELPPPREALGALAHQLARGTAEDQEPRGSRASIRKHAENGKKVGPPLDLINHDQIVQGTERRHRFGQPGQAYRIFQIEVVRRCFGEPFAGDRGLPGLARTDEHENRGSFESPPKGVVDSLSLDLHAGNRP